MHLHAKCYSKMVSCHTQIWGAPGWRDSVTNSAIFDQLCANMTILLELYAAV